MKEDVLISPRFFVINTLQGIYSRGYYHQGACFFMQTKQTQRTRQLVILAMLCAISYVLTYL
ncbi:MAG: hypothetical protein RSD46_04230, partial [Oscillospiraceae bacterium]